jgi:DNA-directed RNA polymerase specialized sigma24 family protein
MKVNTEFGSHVWHYDDYDSTEYWQAMAQEYGVDELLTIEPSHTDVSEPVPSHIPRIPQDYSNRTPTDTEEWLNLSQSAITRTMRDIYIPGYDPEDLRQDLIEGLLRGIPDYDPSRSQPSTFAATLIYNSAVSALRWHTAQKRTPGSRVHVKTNDRYEKLRNGLLELGVPVTASHFDLSKDPADVSIDSELKSQVHRWISSARLTRLETHAILDNLFYNGERRKLVKQMDSKSLSNALARAKEKLAKVPVDRRFSILSET